MNNREVLRLLRRIDNGYKPSDEEQKVLCSIESITWKTIKEIPESISMLKGLRNLDVSGMDILNPLEITTLPDGIGNLTNLQNLSLWSTQISSLPGTIGNLTNLRSLDLSYTQISSLPETIGNLTSLQNINLWNTQIKTLPKSIGNMTNLYQLKLMETKTEFLPDTIGNLTGLQYLDLSNTPINSLPITIGNLKSLYFLDLSNTLISYLPETIGRLENLLILNLNNTQISSLPKTIGNLKKLETLDLSSSQIRELPEEIEGLREIKYLGLSNLTMLELPHSILSLNLEFEDHYSRHEIASGIYIHNLRLINQPREVFSQSRDLIIEYFRTNKQSAPINECKVVFLGDGGAGKSLMIDRLMHDGDISPDFNGESTPGICISSKKYQVEGEEFELHFWDFGGQAIMHSMHRLFLTNRTLYVIVANARDNKANDQAWYWIRNIKSFANGVPVLLLINQKDQNSSVNVNENGLRKEYPALKEIRIVSALKDTKDEFNRDIRDVISQTVVAMETVHTPFSRAWLSLMNELQDMQEDYITSDIFYIKCRENGIDIEEGILDELISWYQDLGVCFYSKRHPTSGQYMVLKPRWLLNALYMLIFNGREYASNGIIHEDAIYDLICKKISKEDIKKVWSDIKYEPHEIQYIINVLLNFELIYRLEQNSFFVPMLCDENEPQKMDSFDSEDTLHVSFVYTYLPENVLHRLMVRHGHELNTNIVWRTGAEFRSKRCGWTALVSIKDECLDVFVKAEQQESHPAVAYLDLMRESIYEINEDFGLVADEYIEYRRGGQKDRFQYPVLIGSLEAEIDKVYSCIFKRALNIREILGTVTLPKDTMTNGVIEQMLYALDAMSERAIYLRNRGEIELTADFQAAIEPVLNEMYGIQIAREYTVGVSNKEIGETDLCFFINRHGKREGLYILENKVIQNFKKQYWQLLGYLNPNYLAGITLSINKEKGWEEAYDYICDKLIELKQAGGEFAPQHIERSTEKMGTRYVKTKHIVPETGFTMPIYHLVLQLSDEARKRVAKKGR